MDFKNDPQFIELYSKLNKWVCAFWDGKGRSTEAQLVENVEAVIRAIKALALYWDVDYEALLKLEADLSGNLPIDVMRLYYETDNKKRFTIFHKLISIQTLMYAKLGKNIENVK